MFGVKMSFDFMKLIPVLHCMCVSLLNALSATALTFLTAVNESAL